MNLRNDPDFLRNSQYRTDKNLQARIRLHERFSTNPSGWTGWVLNHIDQLSSRKILEVGSGPGSMWRDWNPSGDAELPKLFLNDFSYGMLQAARSIEHSAISFNLSCNDVQALPYARNCVDLVIANHMLYHVPDIQMALSEIQRVLKPRGTFLAATNGHDHMKEMDELVLKAAPNLPNIYHVSRKFKLENGFAFLTQFFDEIQLDLYEDSLVITEEVPLLEYIVSIWEKFIDDMQFRAIKAEIEKLMASNGEIRIQKSTGIFICKNNRQ